MKRTMGRRLKKKENKKREQVIKKVLKKKKQKKEEKEEEAKEEEEEMFVCSLLGCLTSHQHASVSQGRICSDNLTCCHTEIQAAD